MSCFGERFYLAFCPFSCHFLFDVVKLRIDYDCVFSHEFDPQLECHKMYAILLLRWMELLYNYQIFEVFYQKLLKAALIWISAPVRIQSKFIYTKFVLGYTIKRQTIIFHHETKKSDLHPTRVHCWSLYVLHITSSSFSSYILFVHMHDWIIKSL